MYMRLEAGHVYKFKAIITINKRKMLYRFMIYTLINTLCVRQINYIIVKKLIDKNKLKCN